MEKQHLQKFLNIIDGRIKKYINESKLIKQYMGVVVSEAEGTKPNTKYNIRLLGNDTVFNFLNKTGEALTEGDGVYVQTIGTDLNTGIIITKTKESNNIVDYIIDQGNITTQWTWEYRKWNSGKVELWANPTIEGVDIAGKDSSTGEVYYSAPLSCDLPFKLASSVYSIIGSGGMGIWFSHSAGQENFNFRAFAFKDFKSKTIYPRIYAWSTWK